MSGYDIIERSTGRVVIQAEDAAVARGIAHASMRKDIKRRRERGQITELEPLNARTPVYYPEDLGIEEIK